MTVIGTTMRVLLANRFGTVQSEIQPALGPISWRLNNIGRVQFVMSREDEKATETGLAFGSLVYIEFDNGLPPWAGVIDPPRSWAPGLIGLTAYSAEYLLGLRQTGKARYFTGATVGEIFTSLIQEANTIFKTGIDVGAVWPGEDPHWPEYHYGNLLEIIQKDICQQLGTADFDITPSLSSQNDVIVGGQIFLKANLYERRGTRKNGVALIQGHNAEISLQEQGPIINSWDLAGATVNDESGKGDGWGDERLDSRAEDLASITAYGLRQGSRVHGDIDIQESLDTYARSALVLSKDPKNIIGIRAANIAPALFSDYDVGDVVRVIAHDLGFELGLDTMVRVLSREFNPEDGSCTLVVQEEIGTTSTLAQEIAYEFPTVNVPFSPASVSGLVAWYDFSDISTLYQNSAKTTPVTSDADPIGAVADKSGNGNDAIQGTSAAKPTYKTAVQNGLSAALGDGGDLLATGAFTEISQPNTIFLVVKEDAVSGFPYVVDGISSTKGNAIRFVQTASSVYVHAGVDLTITGVLNINPNLWTAIYNGASSNLRKNGASVVTGNAGTEGLTGVSLFGAYTGGQFTGHIMEYLVYDGEITGTDLSDVETYLNDKWAVY